MRSTEEVEKIKFIYMILLKKFLNDFESDLISIRIYLKIKDASKHIYLNRKHSKFFILFIFFEKNS